MIGAILAAKATCPSCLASIYQDACETITIKTVLSEKSLPGDSAYDIIVSQCSYCHIWVESHREQE